MAEIDTSFYSKPANPLTQIGQTIDTARGITAQNLLQQELQGRTGTAQLYANAPKDSSGNIDTNYLQQNIGRAGIMAPDVAKNALELGRAGQQLTQEKLTTSIKTNEYAAGGLVALMSDPSIFDKNGNVIDEKALNKGLANITAGTVAASGGAYSPQQAAMDWADVVNSGKPRAAMMKHVATAQARSGQLQQAYQTLYAKNPALDNSAEVWDPEANNGRGAYTANVKPAPSSTTFGEAPQPKNSSEDQSQQPQLAQQIPPQKREFSSMPVDSGDGQLSQPSIQQPQNDNVMLSAPPGVEEMQTNTGHQAAERVGSIISNSQNAPIAQDVNNQIINLAKKLGAGGVGPTQTEITNLVGKIEDSPVLGTAWKTVTGDNPAKDAPGQLMELKKFLLRSAQQRASDLGVHTDFQSGLNVDANPNDKQFPEVIEKLAKYNNALSYLDQGKANALQSAQGATTNPAAQEKFEKDFRNAANVDVYRLMLASPEERKDILGSMSKEKIHKIVEDKQKLQKMNAIPDSLISQFKTEQPQRAQ